MSLSDPLTGFCEWQEKERKRDGKREERDNEENIKLRNVKGDSCAYSRINFYVGTGNLPS